MGRRGHKIEFDAHVALAGARAICTANRQYTKPGNIPFVLCVLVPKSNSAKNMPYPGARVRHRAAHFAT